MNFRFGVVAIFLILDVISARSTAIAPLKRKRNANNVQISSDVATDSSIQSVRNRRSFQNLFLQPSNSNRKRSFLSNSFTSQTSDIVFPDDDFISFLNNNNTSTSIKIDTTNAPVLNTPAPDNDFISHVSTSSKIHPSVSPSLTNLLFNKITPVKRISGLKCEEYTREIMGTTSTVSLTDPLSNFDNTCGIVHSLRITGAEAQVGEFPHMVALGKLTGKLTSINEFTFMCGGTLISPIWVLTAAHCTSAISDRPNAVKMGINQLSDPEGVTVLIKRIIRHPDFNPPPKYADIALIELMDAVSFSTVIRPACLYQQYDAVPRKAWISGWGLTDFAGEPSDELYKTRLNVVDNTFCTIQYNLTDNTRSLPYGISPSMICAGDPRGNWTKDSCQGDSGGPLQVYPEDECQLFQVVGIISFGIGCGLYEIPSVYTRVSYFLPWIEDIVWPPEQ